MALHEIGQLGQMAEGLFGLVNAKGLQATHGYRAATPPPFLSDMAPAQRADLFPALMSPLREELGGRIVPGTT